jgi:phage replication-related protein YjqB (UPF0714/DUF867 family)
MQMLKQVSQPATIEVTGSVRKRCSLHGIHKPKQNQTWSGGAPKQDQASLKRARHEAELVDGKCEKGSVQAVGIGDKKDTR